MSNKLSENTVRSLLSGMIPEKVTLSGVVLDDKKVGVVLAVPVRDQAYESLSNSIENTLKKQSDIEEVTVVLNAPAPTPERPKPPTAKPLEGVKRIIAVASGKGGVGKSTVAANLAVACAKAGHQVGLVDADIYGPSIAHMMGVKGKPEIANKQMTPPIAHDVKVMSMGMLLDEDAPVVWRGPMVSKALGQLMKGADWGELDYLFIDLPPGTGDIHLSIAQNFEVDTAVVVTTPQQVAHLDVVKAIKMFEKLSIPVCGLVDNMSFLETDHGDRLYPFGEGKTTALSSSLNIPVLVSLPLNELVSRAGDEGTPVATYSDAYLKHFNTILSSVEGKQPY